MFPHLAKVPLQTKFINDLLVRIAVLLDESLQNDSLISRQQALISFETVINWVSILPREREKRTETLYNFGIVQLAIKHLEGRKSLQVKQRSLHLLAEV